MPDTRLILHVKGTEQETTTLPKQVVRAAISQGQITHSQLIWSVVDKTWKQVRELPHLLPSQKLAPAPVRAPTGAMPKVTAAPQATPVPRAKTGPTPRIAKVAGSVPTVKAVAGAPTVKAAAPTVATAVPAEAPAKSYVVKEQNAGAHPLKWLSIALGVLIFVLVSVNYFLVNYPLVSGLSQTPYAHATVYAHLGAYIQPNVIVIHIPASTTITRDNLTDFLGAVARSTPSAPLSSNNFARVALTSGWTASYTLSGNAWKDLADLPDDQRKEALLTALNDAGGDSLMSPQGNRDEAALQVEREKVWDAFVAQFTKP